MKNLKIGICGWGNVATGLYKTIKNNYDQKLSNNTSIIYGGSCKPTNAKAIFSENDIDGGLIGGASLQSADFTSIISSI